jgi:ABC-type transport system involved in multi-copper enzyme maturation permease subunit
MSLARPGSTWFGRHFAWSNSRQSWVERLCGLALAAAAICLVWQGGNLSALHLVILWGLFVAGAFGLERLGWIKLFGPILFYDMVRSGRRGRYILLRCCFAAVLLLMLFSAFLSYILSPLQVSSPRDLATRAENYFEILIVTQLLTVMLLTPVFVAGAVAEEKDRRTMEYLLATDLRGREIVLSKLTARLASLTMLVLTGLPIVSGLQFLGGVDPNLVLTGFAAVGLTMLGLAGLGILLSTYLRRPRDAIAMTYVGLIAYYVASFLTLEMIHSRAAWLNVAVWFGDSGPTVADLFKAFNAGNVFFQIGEVATAGYRGTLAQVLPAVVGSYALFNGVVAGVCVTWAVLRLRPVAIKQMQGKTRRRRNPLQLFRRPRIGSWPMMWKEIFVDGSAGLGWLGRIVLALLMVATFLWGGYLTLQNYVGHSTSRHWSYDDDGLARVMNEWVRTAGTLVACVTLLWVAVRASTCVSRERDRQTMDALLTTPLDSSDILVAKCVGNVLGVRRLWFWLGGVWAIGLFTGGLHPIALILVISAWFVFASFLSVLGAWFSVVSRTSLRATVWTLLSAGMLGVGHWLIWACCLPVLFLGRAGPMAGAEYLVKFQAGLTPPASLVILQFSGYEFQNRYAYRTDSEAFQFLGFALFGLFVWGLFTLLLYQGVSTRFRVLTNRLRVSGPARDPYRARQREDSAPRSSGTAMVAPGWGAVLVEEKWDSPREADKQKKGRRPDL